MRATHPVGRGLAVGLIGALSVGVASIGVATAANGGSLTLGHSNSATKTTTLQDKKGTPLSLVGKKSKPPLKVNSSKLVRHLNAAELGGLSAQQLSTGSSASLLFDLPNAIAGHLGKEVILPVAGPGTPPAYAAEVVAHTGSLAAGTYMATAVAVANAPGSVICYMSLSTAFPGSYALGTADPEGNSAQEAVETQSFVVKAGQRITEYCFDVDTIASDEPATVSTASITAIRVAKNVPGGTGTAVVPAVRHRAGGLTSPR